MTRTIRSALVALLLTAASFLTAAFLTAPAQAAAAGDAPAGIAPAATGSALPRLAHNPARTAGSTVKKAEVKRVAAAAATRGPLAGFCTFDGYDGVTSYIGCSLAIPATVYVYCSNGNIFYGYLPYAGVWSLTATPCYATGYSLV